MAYVVTSNCRGCRYTDCVEVCPVDCFYALPDMLVINPDECIECGVCAPECRVDAIYADSDVPADQQDMIAYNRDKAHALVVSGNQPITESEDPLPGADERAAELGY